MVVTTPCQRCTDCLKNVVDNLKPKLTGSSGTFAAIALAWCNSQDSYNQTGCSALQAAISSSYKNNLALRAGAVCSRIGECSPARIAEGSCGGTVTAGGNTAALDACTADGLATGTSLPGIFNGSGELLLHCISCVVL